MCQMALFSSRVVRRSSLRGLFSITICLGVTVFMLLNNGRGKNQVNYVFWNGKYPILAGVPEETINQIPNADRGNKLCSSGRLNSDSIEFNNFACICQNPGSDG